MLYVACPGQCAIRHATVWRKDLRPLKKGRLLAFVSRAGQVAARIDLPYRSLLALLRDRIENACPATRCMTITICLDSNVWTVTCDIPASDVSALRVSENMRPECPLYRQMLASWSRLLTIENRLSRDVIRSVDLERNEIQSLIFRHENVVLGIKIHRSHLQVLEILSVPISCPVSCRNSKIAPLSSHLRVGRETRSLN